MNDTFESLSCGDVFSMRGKRVVLTGASGIIGSGIARVFARNGAALYLTDIDAARLDALRADLAENGATAAALAADLRSFADMAAVAQGKRVVHFFMWRLPV